jgi:glycosyltransferase involved in cell wall biosynthesis
MTIAINTRLNKETQPEGYEVFLFEMLGHLTRRFPEHKFIYIFDQPYHAKQIFAKNVLTIVAGPKTSSTLRLQYWFNYRIPAILRKHKADVLLSMEGICSLRTKVPQCLLLSDLGFLDHPQLLKRSQARFYKKNTLAFLAKAKSITTASGFSRSLIADRYKINAEGITVIDPIIDNIFKPIDWEEKELIKEKYTDGKAYFLFSGDVNERSNLINLLKAFSFFKKRQRSSMLLLIAGNADESFKTALKTYKLRTEVKLLEGLEKEALAKITAAAYALVYPVLYAGLALPVVQAIHCAVPVITTDEPALTASFGEAALYADPDDHEDIAEKMMLVFKDENKANEMVKAGNELMNQDEAGKNADLLMQCILNAADS